MHLINELKISNTLLLNRFVHTSEFFLSPNRDNYFRAYVYPEFYKFKVVFNDRCVSHNSCQALSGIVRRNIKREEILQLKSVLSMRCGIGLILLENYKTKYRI